MEAVKRVENPSLSQQADLLCGKNAISSGSILVFYEGNF